MPAAVDLKTTAHPAHGDHLCAIYGSDRQWERLITTYVSAGLAGGNRVSYFTSERSPDKVIEVLRNGGIEVYDAMGRDALRVIDSAYDGFDPEAMMTGLAAAIDEAHDDGFPGIRFLGEMGWATDPEVTTDDLARYEGMVTQYYRSRAVDGICLYDTRLFDERFCGRLIGIHPGMAMTMPRLRSSSLGRLPALGLAGAGFWAACSASMASGHHCLGIIIPALIAAFGYSWLNQGMGSVRPALYPA